MNSFTFVARGIQAEVARQVLLYEAGEQVVQETLHFDPQTGTISPLRSKEEADDYRYFPEPDLVPVEPPAEAIERLRGELPELPAARIRRLETEVGYELAEGLVTSGRGGLYERVPGERRVVANVVMNQVAATGADPAVVDATELGRLVEARERIPRAAFDEAVAKVAEPGFTADPYLAQEAVTDAAELDPVIDGILAANPGQVDAYRGGKEGLLGFFVGQVMKATDGKANPKVVNERVREKLRV
jgi:aspartyl-tRNA(Asn)/glutamyl-tRNA(Gln) amidotransferase subunit B